MKMKFVLLILVLSIVALGAVGFALPASTSFTGISDVTLTASQQRGTALYNYATSGSLAPVLKLDLQNSRTDSAVCIRKVTVDSPSDVSHITNVQFYRDNGDGVFDPSTDIKIDGNWDISSGTAQHTFPGCANVNKNVTAGQTATFFIAYQMDSDAPAGWYDGKIPAGGFEIQIYDSSSNSYVSGTTANDLDPDEDGLLIDNSNPETSGLSVSANPARGDVTVEATGQDDTGVSGINLCVDDSNCATPYQMEPNNGPFGDTLEVAHYILDTVGLSDGAHTLYAWAIDIAGKVDSTVESLTQFVVDNTKPTTVINPVPEKMNVDTYTFTGTSSDSTTNIDRVTYSLDSSSGPWFDATPSDGAFDSTPENWEFTKSGIPEGQHTLYVRAADDAGNVENPVSATFCIDTEPPVADATSGNYLSDDGTHYVANEGQTITLDASGSTDNELCGGMTYEWTVTYVDENTCGETTTTLTGETVSYTSWQNGNYQITLKVTDAAGNTATDTTYVEVRNVAPTVTHVSSSSSWEEGKDGTVDVQVSDPSPCDTLNVDIDWADNSDHSTCTATDNNGVLSCSADHVYADQGRYTLTVVASDSDNGESQPYSSYTLDVEDNEPGVGQRCQNGVLTVTPEPSNEGSDATITFDICAETSDDLLTGYTVNWGDGTPSYQQTYRTPVESDHVTLTHNYTADSEDETNGKYTITVTARDEDSTSSETYDHEVDNVLPVITDASVEDINEGETAILTAHISDVGSDDNPLTWHVDWTGMSKYLSSDGVGYGDISIPMEYLDSTPAGDHETAYLEVDDSDGGAVYASPTFVVHNVAPTISVVSVNEAPEGSQTSITFNFTDPAENHDNPYDITVYWNDGSNTHITRTYDNNEVTMTHVYGEDSSYRNDGKYRIKIHVCDKDGGCSDLYQHVVIPNENPVISDFSFTSGNNNPLVEGRGGLLFFHVDDAGVYDDQTWTINYSTRIMGGTLDAYDDSLTSDYTSHQPYSGHFQVDQGVSPYCDNGTYNITLRDTDDDGGYDEKTITVTVLNSDPDVVQVTPHPEAEGEASSVEAWFGDEAGACDNDYSYTINWGDGTTTTGTTQFDTLHGYGYINEDHVYTDNCNEAKGDDCVDNNGIYGYNVVVEVCDKDGGCDSNSAAMFVENSDPVVNVTTPDDNDIESGSATVSWTLSDEGSRDTFTCDLQMMECDQNQQCTDAGMIATDVDAGQGQNSYTFDTTGYSDGLYYVVVTCYDNDGGAGSDDTGYFTIDNTAPQSTLWSLGNYTNEDTGVVYVTHDGQFRMRSEDATTVVSEMDYTATNHGAPMFGWNSRNTNSQIATWDFTASGRPDGLFDIHYRAKDIAGNEEQWKTETFYMDNTPPETTISIGVPNATNNNVLYVSQDTPITFTASDSGSGVDKIYIKINGGAWGETSNNPTTIKLTQYSGPVTVYYYAVDNLGNNESESDGPHEYTVYVDAYNGPTSIYLGSPKYSQEPTYVNASTEFEITGVDWDVSQMGSGVDRVYYTITKDGQVYSQGSDDSTTCNHVTGSDMAKCAHFTIPDNGVYSIEYWHTDNVGNEAPHHTINVVVDNDVPETSFIAADDAVWSEPRDALWTRPDLTHQLTANDLPQSHNSGLAHTYWTSCDGQPHEVTMTYDQNDNIYKGDVSFNGCADGEYTTSYWSVDNLGNTEGPNTKDVIVDNTAPEITINHITHYFSPNGDGSNDEMVLNFTPTDNLANMTGELHYNVKIYDGTTLIKDYAGDATSNDSVKITWDGTAGGNTLGDGNYTIEITVTDMAGNAGEKDDWTYIDTVPPEVSDVFVGKTWVRPGESVYVEARVEDAMSIDPDMMCDVSINGTSAGELEYDEATSLCSGYAEVPEGIADGTYTIEVTGYDSAGNRGTDHGTIRTDSTVPGPELNLEPDRYFVRSGDLVHFTVEVSTDDESGLDGFCYVRMGDLDWKSYSLESGQCEGDYQVPQLDDGEYKFEAGVKDNAGNWNTTDNRTILRVDNTPPVQTLYKPEPGEYYSTVMPIEIVAVDGNGTGVNDSSVKARIYEKGFLGIKQDVRGPVVLNATGNGTYTGEFDISDLSEDGDYYFAFESADELGNLNDTQWHSVKFYIDHTAPIWSGDARLTVTSSPYDKDGNVQINWPGAEDAKSGVAKYRVYVSADGSNWTFYNETAGTSYAFENLTDGTWHFMVKPVDKAGNEGSGLTGSTTVDRTCAVDVTCHQTHTGGGSSGGGGGSSSGGYYSGSSSEAPAENQTNTTTQTHHEEPECGNGIIEAGEQCDTTGTLQCLTDDGYLGTQYCDSCQLTSCNTTEYCGDGICNGRENQTSCPEDCTVTAHETQNQTTESVAQSPITGRAISTRTGKIAVIAGIVAILVILWVLLKK